MKCEDCKWMHDNNEPLAARTVDLAGPRLVTLECHYEPPKAHLVPADDGHGGMGFMPISVWPTVPADGHCSKFVSKVEPPAVEIKP